MINRRAILLAAGSDKAPLRCVTYDLEIFHLFLKSNIGGAWDDGEVVLQVNPTRDQVISAIQEAADADYCMVFFAGSGKKVKNKLPWFEMEMSLSSGEVISERELNSGSLRCTLIFDCSYRASTGRYEPILEGNSKSRSDKNQSPVYRTLYESSLEETENGLVRVAHTSALANFGSAFWLLTSPHLVRKSPRRWHQTSHTTL